MELMAFIWIMGSSGLRFSKLMSSKCTERSIRTNPRYIQIKKYLKVKLYIAIKSQGIGLLKYLPDIRILSSLIYVRKFGNNIPTFALLLKAYKLKTMIIDL